MNEAFFFSDPEHSGSSLKHLVLQLLKYPRDILCCKSKYTPVLFFLFLTQ